MVFGTHRELFRLRPHWQRPGEACNGLMQLDPFTEQDSIRVAVCDGCGLVIGIPEHQWQDHLLKHTSRPEAACGSSEPWEATGGAVRA